MAILHENCHKINGACDTLISLFSWPAILAVGCMKRGPYVVSPVHRLREAHPEHIREAQLLHKRIKIVHKLQSRSALMKRFKNWY